jgi:hypothetical protein
MEGRCVEEVEIRLVDLLRKKGHDGIVYANAVEGAGDSWVIFEADQVTRLAIWRYEPELEGSLRLVHGPKPYLGSRTGPAFGP